MRLIRPSHPLRTAEHNVGGYNLGRGNVGGYPAPFGFYGGRFPRGNVGNRLHNGGQAHNMGEAPPNSSAHCHSPTGWPGIGGYPGCAPVPAPEVPMDPRTGCAIGWDQCKQDLSVQSLAVPAGTQVQITVTPRRVYTPYYYIYLGALGTFTIDSVQVDGTEYLGSAVPELADTYQPIVTDLSVSWGQFSSTTPLIMLVTNISGAPADFRSTLKGVASRG